MEIRLLADSRDDAPQVAKWYYEQWEINNPDSSVEKITEKILLGAQRDQLPIAFVVHLDGQLVGAGEVKYRELPQYPGFNHWLDGVYVPSEHRGKGISTLLINFANNTAKECGVKDLYLRCEEHNVKLYEKYGYKVVLTEENKSIMKRVIND